MRAQEGSLRAIDMSERKECVELVSCKIQTTRTRTAGQDPIPLDVLSLGAHCQMRRRIL